MSQPMPPGIFSNKITSSGGGGGGGFGSEGSGGVSGETSPRTMFGVLFRSGVSGEM